MYYCMPPSTLEPVDWGWIYGHDTEDALRTFQGQREIKFVPQHVAGSGRPQPSWLGIKNRGKKN